MTDETAGVEYLGARFRWTRCDDTDAVRSLEQQPRTTSRSSASLRELQFVDLDGADLRAIVLVLENFSDQTWLELLDPLTGAIPDASPPSTGSEHELRIGPIDTAPGPDLLFSVGNPLQGTHRLIGNTGGGPGLKWSVDGDLLLVANLVAEERSDLLMLEPFGTPRLINGNTGLVVVPAPPVFAGVDPASLAVVDVDGDATAEILVKRSDEITNAGVYDWNGFAVVALRQIPFLQIGDLAEAGEVHLDSDFLSSETYLVSSSRLLIVDGVSGTTRFDSTVLEPTLTEATEVWNLDFIPTSEPTELMVCFPGTFPPRLLLIGAGHPQSERERRQPEHDPPPRVERDDIRARLAVCNRLCGDSGRLLRQPPRRTSAILELAGAGIVHDAEAVGIRVVGDRAGLAAEHRDLVRVENDQLPSASTGKPQRSAARFRRTGDSTNMQNIEIKARVPDRATLLAAIERLGARPVWERAQRDTFFLVPQGYLKLREVDGEPAELIAYERAPGSEPRPSDYDIATTADGPMLRTVLARSLGVRGVVAKRRVLHLWAHTRIHLDEVDGLGTFLELETVADGMALEQAHAEAAAVMEALSIRSEDLLDRPYLELLERPKP